VTDSYHTITCSAEVVRIKPVFTSRGWFWQRIPIPKPPKEKK